MQQQPNYIIECKNLTHYYGKKLVYENLNFRLPEGKIMGLLGKNGAGKSTTINILNGFLQPRSGECLIFGENSQHLSAQTKKRIGYLIEGHVQYSFMNVHQIERFYSGFYENWDASAYWNLINRLKILPHQKISTMSCGQRAQVALGLILAQDPDLLILDDFSLGLDPGYRRLFIDYMRDYCKTKKKTVFLTSHIIQDVEKLIDDVLIMDYNRVLFQGPVADFMNSFHGYAFNCEQEDIELKDPMIVNVEHINQHYEVYSYETEDKIMEFLQSKGIAYQDFHPMKLTLEDAFIGLTGRY